ncbi:MAG: N-acetyl sugar amidotransferase [Candidatus Tectomicrobia bacterium]|uniref:N-acetyl sugar amidotransferase n=1 Tax=Tectimicrobiota bacterium TaxID=2528274 RepID=A0A932MLV9_UNCTE|nr:N-acetyl sugar amidotransferase [Candidatus Tectomicrobia bacterium]
MQFCKRCLVPTTRPGITFDAEGICFPCRVAERHEAIDWDARRKELEKIAEWGRANSRCDYDCLIGVSGGKDSTRQALFARDDLGLRPLLVCCTYPPEQQSDLGAYNLNNLISLGFDTMVVGPSPEKWKRLMRKAFFKYGNWAKPTEMALYAIPPRIAIAYGIPLIFLGENNALASGDLGGSHTGDANRIKYNNTLSGGDPSEFLGDGIAENDIYWHTFPSDEEMARANIRIVYMGYYIMDFDPFVNTEIAKAHGLRARDVKEEDIGALNLNEDLDEDLVHVNQMLKFMKLGFARATDDACQMIRRGLLTREEGADLVRRYDGRCADRYVRMFCDYLGITVEEFWRHAEKFRNPDIWEKNGTGEWRLKHPVE